jgi:ABC-type polysaccharide/polyol phosphate transport system ATPase subunit
MAIIDLDKVSLTFKVRQKGRVSFKEFLVKRMFWQSVNPYREVRALQNVSLRLGDGQRIGIVGHNGAGKSTLLKLLAGIYPPTEGKRVVKGRISSLFDIALGFEVDANGWENIAYRSYLQGETPKSLRSKIDPIASFSELGDYLNMPVRYYSAGMIVRLAFSIATAIEPEILLVDEVLSVGDMAFQHKARQRIHEMIAKAEIIVVVSHDLESLAKICDQAIWMDHGTVRQFGPVQEIIDAYTASVQGPQSQAA